MGERLTDLQTLVDPVFDLPKASVPAIPSPSEILVKAIPHQLSREHIMKFQDHLALLPRVHGESQHFFGDCTYMRLWRQPAGSVFTGKIHAQDHVIIFISGRVTTIVNSEDMEDIEGPYIAEARAGIKRLVIAHTEALIATVHANPTNTRDLSELEKQLIVPEDGSVIAGTADSVV